MDLPHKESLKCLAYWFHTPLYVIRAHPSPPTRNLLFIHIFMSECSGHMLCPSGKFSFNLLSVFSPSVFALLKLLSDRCLRFGSSLCSYILTLVILSILMFVYKIF